MSYKVLIDNTTGKYSIIFEEPVNGLYLGSEVFVNGIPVGSVKSIDIYNDDYSKALVVINTDKPLPKLEYSRAEICIRSFAGHYAINITYDKNPIKLEDINGVQQIQANPSFMHRIKQRVEGLTTEENMQTVVQQTKDTLAIMKNTFDEIMRTLRGINKIMDELGPVAGNLGNILRNAETGLKDILPILAQIRTFVENEQTQNLLGADLKTVSHIIADLKECTAKATYAMREFNKGPVHFLLHGKQVKK